MREWRWPEHPDVPHPPDEGIKIKFFVKTPGQDSKWSQRLCVSDIQTCAPNGIHADDYERLIHDAFVGDQTLSPHREIMASWNSSRRMKSWKNLPLVKVRKGTPKMP